MEKNNKQMNASKAISWHAYPVIRVDSFTSEQYLEVLITVYVFSRPL